MPDLTIQQQQTILKVGWMSIIRQNIGLDNNLDFLYQKLLSPSNQQFLQMLQWKIKYITYEKPMISSVFL